MPCFFCNSDEHLTIYCNIYASDAERKKIAKSKNCCQNCLIENGMKKICNHKFKGRAFICYNKECFICFSKKHSTVFCSDRFNNTHLQFFLPKIDSNLLPRFLKIFDFIEQQFLAINALPASEHLFNLKPMNVIAEMNPEKLYKASKDQKIKVLVYKEMHLYDHGKKDSWDYKPKDLKPLPLKNIVFKPQKIFIHSSKVFTEDFFQFLGPSTKELLCVDLELTNDVKFGELLPRIPNVKHVYLRQTNIKFDNSWPEILSKSNCSKLEELDFYFENINFDAEVLATFMKEHKICVNLYIWSNVSKDMIKKKEKLLENNILKNFIPVENESKHKSSLLKISSQELDDVYVKLVQKVFEPK